MTIFQNVKSWTVQQVIAGALLGSLALNTWFIRDELANIRGSLNSNIEAVNSLRCSYAFLTGQLNHILDLKGVPDEPNQAQRTN